MSEIHFCKICYSSYGTELHHVIYRSKVPSLTKCKLNHVYLCPKHHRSEVGVHGRDGHKLDLALKLEFQNKLEMLLDKEFLTKDDIRPALDISEKATKRLLKVCLPIKCKYTRQEVIRACMGNKMIIEGEG